MSSNIRVLMGIQDGGAIPDLECVFEKPWSGNKQHINTQIREYMFEMQPSNKFKGHLCAIKIEVFCNTGDWKSDWHFEGFSVFLNLPKVKENEKVRISEQVKLSTTTQFTSTNRPQAKPMQ